MDLTELFGRFGSSRSNSKPNYLLSRSPSTITVAVVRSCSELYHNLARESKLMEEGRQKDLQLLEEIIDKCLTHKLLQTIASRDKIFEDQKAMFEPDMLAFSGCYYGGGDKERRELASIRRRWKTLHVMPTLHTLREWLH